MKISKTEDKIKQLLFDYPTRRFHVREISRLIESSAPAVSKALKILENEEFVSIKKGFLHEILANRTEKFIVEKKLSNLKKIQDSGLWDYLKKEIPLTTIVLFGSYARGEDTEKSDIDIAVLGKEQTLNLKKYSEKLNRPINLEFINLRKISKELRNNILNGTVLAGGFGNEF